MKNYLDKFWYSRSEYVRGAILFAAGLLIGLLF